MTGPPARLTDLDTTQWREDLQFLCVELTTRHKNPFHHTPAEVFEQAIAHLDEKLADLLPYEIVVRFQQIAARIGDGHTFVDAAPHFHNVPMEVFWFGEELRVTRAAHEAHPGLGCRLVRIGTYDIPEVQRRLQSVIPQAENDWYILHQSTRKMMQVETLAVLDVLPDFHRAPLTFEDDDGKRFTLEVTPSAPGTTPPPRDAAVRTPLYRQRPEADFWFTLLPTAGAVYLSFRRYHDLETHVADLMSFVDAHAPRKLIVDLRHNGGGNLDLVRRHLIPEIVRRPYLNRRGGLFVITGRQTFSAAMSNAADFRRRTQALTVGEPAGARPNGYQELHIFTLPNSGLRAGCSICHYRFQDEDTPFVPLDARIDPDWESYKAGHDPVLEWIEHYPGASHPTP